MNQRVVSRPGLCFSSALLKGARPLHISVEGSSSFAMADANIAANYTLMPRFSMRLTYALYCLPFYSSFSSPRHHYRSTSESVSADWHVLCLPILLHLGSILCLTLSPCGRIFGTKNPSIPGIKIRQGPPRAPWCILDRLLIVGEIDCPAFNLSLHATKA